MEQILIPIVVSCLSLIGFFVAIFSGAKHYNDYPQQRITVVGTLYNGLMMLSIGLCLSLVCCRVLFLDYSYSLWMTLGVALYHGLLMQFFLCKFKNQIALYQSNARRSVPGQEPNYINFQTVYQQNTFSRLSENWLVLQQSVPNSLKSQSSLREDELSQQPLRRGGQCAICLSDPLCLVWMPCGHLTVCQSCGKQLRESSRLSCIICKKKCTQIYHLMAVQGREDQVFKSDYFYRVVSV